MVIMFSFILLIICSNGKTNLIFPYFFSPLIRKSVLGFRNMINNYWTKLFHRSLSLTQHLSTFQLLQNPFSPDVSVIM